MGHIQIDCLRPGEEGEDFILLPGVANGGSSNPFVRTHVGMIPSGPVLMLGGHHDALDFAARGIAVTVFEADPLRGSLMQQEARSLGLPLDVHVMPVDEWRPGFERWAAIVALFPQWTTRQRRRIVCRIPNALIPGGIFLFEGLAESPAGPCSLAGHEIEPADFRPEIEVMEILRVATKDCRIVDRQGFWYQKSLLQVVAIHPRADENDEELGLGSSRILGGNGSVGMKLRQL